MSYFSAFLINPQEKAVSDQRGLGAFSAVAARWRCRGRAQSEVREVSLNRLRRRKRKPHVQRSTVAEGAVAVAAAPAPAPLALNPEAPPEGTETVVPVVGGPRRAPGQPALW